MGSQRSILIVEDDHELRRMFRHALSVAGYAVSETADGVNALRFIELLRPELIVLDLGLPLMSGLDVQRDVAAHANTQNVIVVVVTGSPDELEGLAVDCVLRKPVSPDHLVDVVQRCFEAHSKRSTG